MSVQVWNELDEPLGVVRRFGRTDGPRWCARPRLHRPSPAVAIAIGLFAVPRRDAPLNGEPFALAKVEVLPAPPKPAAATVSAGAHEAVAPPIASAEQVEAASGVKVTRASGGGPPKALIIDVATALGVGSRPRKRAIARSMSRLPISAMRRRRTGQSRRQARFIGHRKRKRSSEVLDPRSLADAAGGIDFPANSRSRPPGASSGGDQRALD